MENRVGYTTYTRIHTHTARTTYRHFFFPLSIYLLEIKLFPLARSGYNVHLYIDMVVVYCVRSSTHVVRGESSERTSERVSFTRLMSRTY